MFRRTAKGNVAPVRVIQGSKTAFPSPMGLAIDAEHNELWVANYGDHTALVFSRDAAGDVAPKRISATRLRARQRADLAIPMRLPMTPSAIRFLCRIRKPATHCDLCQISQRNSETGAKKLIAEFQDNAT